MNQIAFTVGLKIFGPFEVIFQTDQLDFHLRNLNIPFVDLFVQGLVFLLQAFHLFLLTANQGELLLRVVLAVNLNCSLIVKLKSSQLIGVVLNFIFVFDEQGAVLFLQF